MKPKQRISAVGELGKLLYEADRDLPRVSLEKRYNFLLRLEVESKTGAVKHRRSECRMVCQPFVGQKLSGTCICSSLYVRFIRRCVKVFSFSPFPLFYHDLFLCPI